MTAPAQIADAVENSRVKIAAGNGDYLDAVVVALADIADAARSQSEECDCTCRHCMTVQRAVDKAGR